MGLSIAGMYLLPIYQLLPIFLRVYSSNKWAQCMDSLALSTYTVLHQVLEIQIYGNQMGE